MQEMSGLEEKRVLQVKIGLTKLLTVAVCPGRAMGGLRTGIAVSVTGQNRSTLAETCGHRRAGEEIQVCNFREQNTL